MKLPRFLIATAALLLPLAAFAAADAAPPKLRLPGDVRPLAYEVTLTVDPRRDDAPGHVEIDVELRRPLDRIWINGAQLTVRGVRAVVGGRAIAGRARAAGEDFIALEFPHRLAQGRARLAIDYTAAVSTSDTAGIFRQKDLDEWYAFTQFEPLDARRAFPSFDEPQWKTPWTVKLRVHREHVAVSNMPVAAERELPDGMKEVRFARTPPLSSYLVAFAVGPFDVVDGGRAGAHGTQLRYIVPKGRAEGTAYARRTTPRLLELLEDYFGIPYPFPKLDSVAIPVTVAFGAMENPGMITYRAPSMVSRPGLEEENFQQRWALVAAHEMAHQWFGDLVTMNWWDDVWLNESFATWMERKIVRRFNPEWETDSFRQRERTSALLADRLATARQVRQPVVDRGDVWNAFDRITYEKGGAVLSMFESWLGETAFRDGVRAYLRQHAWGNASAPDFFTALAKADPSVARAFSSFVLQPGVPIVDIDLDCTPGRVPSLQLHQQRFVPAQPQSAGAAQWMLPFCARFDGGGDAPACTMMQGASQRLELRGASQCPAWVLPNPGGAGYYLWRSRSSAVAAAASAPLRPVEAVALANDAAVLVDSGALPYAALRDLAAPLASAANAEVAAVAASAIAALNLNMLDEPARAALGPWVRERFGARATRLGWVPRAGEDDATLKLRTVLLPLAADEGGDPQLRAQSRALALAWLKGDRASLGSAYEAVLRSAARNADAEVLDAFIRAAREATDGGTRSDIYVALGHVRDPALLRRAFEHGLKGAEDPREGADVFEGASDEPQNADALLAFVRENIATFRAQLPREAIMRMPRWHMQACSPQARDAVRAIYSPLGIPELALNIAQAAETIDICVRAKELNAH